MAKDSGLRERIRWRVLDAVNGRCAPHDPDEIEADIAALDILGLIFPPEDKTTEPDAGLVEFIRPASGPAEILFRDVERACRTHEENLAWRWQSRLFLLYRADHFSGAREAEPSQPDVARALEWLEYGDEYDADQATVVRAELARLRQRLAELNWQRERALSWVGLAMHNAELLIRQRHERATMMIRMHLASALKALAAPTEHRSGNDG